MIAAIQLRRSHKRKKLSMKRKARKIIGSEILFDRLRSNYRIASGEWKESNDWYFYGRGWRWKKKENPREIISRRFSARNVTEKCNIGLCLGPWASTHPRLVLSLRAVNYHLSKYWAASFIHSHYEFIAVRAWMPCTQQIRRQPRKPLAAIPPKENLLRRLSEALNF